MNIITMYQYCTFNLVKTDRIRTTVPTHEIGSLFYCKSRLAKIPAIYITEDGET